MTLGPTSSVHKHLQPLVMQCILYTLHQKHKPTKWEDLWDHIDVARREAGTSVLRIALSEAVVPDETIAPFPVRQLQSQESSDSTMLGLSRRHLCSKEMETKCFSSL